jgi:hypothetical protein
MDARDTLYTRIGVPSAPWVGLLILRSWVRIPPGPPPDSCTKEPLRSLRRGVLIRAVPTNVPTSGLAKQPVHPFGGPPQHRRARMTVEAGGRRDRGVTEFRETTKKIVCLGLPFGDGTS